MKNILKDKEFIKRIICIALYFLTTMLLVYPVASLIGMIFKGASEAVLQVVFQTVMYLILITMSVLLVKSEFVTGINPLKRKKSSETIMEVFIGCVVVYAAMFVGAMLTEALGGAPDSENEAAINAILKAPIGVLLIPIICIIGPVTEELVFRGAIQGSLERLKMPKILCVLVAGTLFGLIHVINAGDYVQLPAYLLAGLAFGFIYYKSENIYVPICVHIIMNSISTGLSYIQIIAELIGIEMA